MAETYPRSSPHVRVRKGTCFVLMPFGARFDDVYLVIHETLQSPRVNLICRRADDFHDPNILETILLNISRAEFIVADLTDSNPNVFYELGIAHCWKDAKNVVLLAQRLDYVPFDLRHLRCVIYSHNTHGLEALREELVASFQQLSRNSFRFRVREGQRFDFGRKLVGRRNNLFSLGVECPMVGHGLVKLVLHFTEHSIDEKVEALESQFLFLSEEQPAVTLRYGPWTIHLVESGDTDAILALDTDG